MAQAEPIAEDHESVQRTYEFGLAMAALALAGFGIDPERRHELEELRDECRARLQELKAEEIDA